MRLYRILAILVAIGAGLTGFAHPAFGEDEMAFEGMSYLDNGEVRVGINLDLGGAITFLADAEGGENIINNFDWGRQIQMSCYSGPNPYAPNGKQPREHWKELGWNPIQSGDDYGNRSRVIAHKNDGKELYVKCIPMIWPLDNEPAECTYECWLRLEGNTVHVRARINNERSDKTQYFGRGQEVPAVYLNGPFHRLASYVGPKPFTGGELTHEELRVQMPATEGWAAAVRDDGWGLGVWKNDTCSFISKYLSQGEPVGTGGSKDNPTAYISPVHKEILDHNIHYEYEYVLILGTVKEIRKYVYAHAEKGKLPDYQFMTDRQHWYYHEATDTGWPIQGELKLKLTGNPPLMFGPSTCFQAEDVPKLYVRMAHDTQAESARVLWKRHGEKDFSEEQSLPFDIIADGEYHTYEVELASSPAYHGAIVGLGLVPAASPEDGDSVRVKYISAKRGE